MQIFKYPVGVSALLLAILSVLPPAIAQTSTGAPPVSSQSIQETQKNQAKKGKVVFSRTTDADGQTTDAVPATAATAVPTDAQPKKQGTTPAKATVPTAEDAERSAVTYTDFDFDVRLRPAESHLAIRALITVRNDGKTPLAHLPLQISSTLNWELIRINGRPITFTSAVLNSDADHTGQLHEANVTLPTPLAPGATLQADVTYSGTIAKATQRLLAIGTPPEIADQSDWDRIAPDFTGLRGFGNVVWYPVSSIPVILGDGARLFDEIGQHKLRLAGAHFRMALTAEFPAAEAPKVAMINGHSVTLNIAASTDSTLPTIATVRVEDTTLGFEAPSIFLADLTSHKATNTTLWTRPTSEANVGVWTRAAADVTPFLQGWLGVQPRSQLTILELPEDGDIPFETGSMLATPVRNAAPEVIEGVMAHALTHAWVMSPRAWLSEGVAHFMGTLWLEKQQGRDKALASLDNARPSLALVEPESPGASEGQPLVACISPVYYRTKAAYVFWMLRDLVSDATLSAALRAYEPAKDTTPQYFEQLVEQAGQRHSLAWFFTDWVYTDKGLPDLTIDNVFSSAAAVAGTNLVAINLSNNGYVAVEAPVQVISSIASVTQRVLLQARSKTVQRILLQGTPTEVRLNDGTIPETQATEHRKTLEGPATQP